MMGAERRTMVMTEQEKMLTAYHEGGHAIVALNAFVVNLRDDFPLHFPFGAPIRQMLLWKPLIHGWRKQKPSLSRQASVRRALKRAAKRGGAAQAKRGSELR